MVDSGKVSKKKGQARNFKAEWKVNRPWLKYNERKDCCYCTLCSSEFAVRTSSVKDHECNYKLFKYVYAPS